MAQWFRQLAGFSAHGQRDIASKALWGKVIGVLCDGIGTRVDGVVKSQNSDGLEKSAKFKARKSEGMRRTYGTPQPCTLKLYEGV